MVVAAPLTAAPAGQSDAFVTAPLTAAPFTAAPLAAATDRSNAVAVAPFTAAPVSFPRPTSYGVYAISDNRLIKLEQVHAPPVDRRAGNQLQILEPGVSVIAPGTLTFLVFRRDLVSNAPEKVPLRIAARVARSMNFDSSGKAVMTTRPNRGLDHSRPRLQSAGVAATRQRRNGNAALGRSGVVVFFRSL